MLGKMIGAMQDIRQARWLRREVGSDEASIPTHTTIDEKIVLYHLAKNLPTGSAILEIGAYLGASTVFLAAGSRYSKSTVYCVDTFQNETMPDGERDTYAEFSQNTRRHASRISVLRGRSDDANLLSRLPSNIELLFLDGDHTYENVRSELATFVQLLGPSAVIAMHDVKAFDGVQLAMAEQIVKRNLRLHSMVQNLAVLKRR